jgi:alkylation response protein AidB-like acyl-CoA dehydrogenase
VTASDLLTRARGLRELIEAEADQVESSLGMTPPIVDALVESGLFRLLVPESLGGFEADPSTILDVCEELSYADGSVGWAFAQNTTVLAYSAYLDPELALPVARSRAGAGQFAPIGAVHKEGDGFRVSGRFQFGSGCGHADFMGGAGMEMHDGEMPGFVDGLPLIRAFIVPADRVAFKGNWDVMGLSGTGSFDYEVQEQTVPAGMTFSIFEMQPRSGGALYGLGPVPLGTISSVAWALGVAERALSEIVEIVKAGRTRMGSAALREQQVFQRDFGTHHMALKAARLLAHECYGSTVDAIARGEAKNACMERVRETRAAASYVTQVAKAAVTFAYEASGSHGLRNPSLLQRCFRDMYVGASHLVFDERNYVETVKTRLGLEPLPF